MVDVRSTECCGVVELDGVGYDSAQSIVEQVHEEWGDYDHTKFRYVVFNDTPTQGSDRPSGAKLANFIKKNKLGDIIVTKSNINPNSGNSLRVWVWTYNRQAVGNFLKSCKK